MRTFGYILALAAMMPTPVQPAPVAGCLLLGDMVAQGLAQYKQCTLVAGAHWSSARIAQQTIKGTYSRVYIVAGNNDPLNPKLGPNLFLIRRKIKAPVTWVAPRNPKAQQRVYETAVHFRDRVVYLSKYKSKDGVQPKSYREVAGKL